MRQLVQLNKNTELHPFQLHKFYSVTFLIMICFLLILSGCAGSEEEDTEQCILDLDNKKFSKVIDNSSCDAYQKGSAYLGLAGFLFENFLVENASDELRTALSLPDDTGWESWSGKTYYESALKATGSGSGDDFEGKTRENQVAEIHLFATIGAMISRFYLDIDANNDSLFLDADRELENYLKLKDSTDSDYGTNSIIAANWFQFVETGTSNVFLLNTTSNSCQPNNTNYDGVFDSSSGAIDSTACGLFSASEISTGLTVSGTCTVVAKVDSIQSLFTETISSGDSFLDLFEEILAYLISIDSDLDDLNVASDSDLRDGLDEFRDDIDNGATCTGTSQTEVNQVLDLVSNTQKSELTSGTYENVNTLKLSTVTSSSDETITDPSFTITNGGVTFTFSCTNSSNLDARLIYNNGSNAYFPYYSVNTSIATTFDSFKNLQNDSSGNEKPSVKGDNIISFNELLCYE